MHTSRRSVLRAGAVTGAAALVPANAVLRDIRPSAAAQPLPSNPFLLGVASGDPMPDGFVIWTRLALDPVADDGLGGMPARSHQVSWQVATDDRFADVVRAGAVSAEPSAAHSVHVEVVGLQPCARPAGGLGQPAPDPERSARRRADHRRHHRRRELRRPHGFATGVSKPPGKPSGKTTRDEAATAD